ncbi:MAG TPA: dephospho-CoA kinase [Candidatus Tumulicola sp.]|nr:dephospho-CoA kinase [Candidatus Tumulicola sp.]HSC33461.1 dephospho-CoA kinase [Gemmatimonadaceae bacterium]
MMLIGLTGNIASGKSSVAKLFAARGATVIDADVLARRAVEPGTSALRSIVARWGTGVLSPDGSLDRAALRHVVFDRPDELEALNAIVHPEVGRLRDQEIAAAAARGDRVVVCDIPLLFERRLVESFSRIVLVDAPRPIRLERLMRDRALSHEEAVQMIAAQMPAELKRARADFVIENAGTREQLAERVSEVWDEIARDANATQPASA